MNKEDKIGKILGLSIITGALVLSMGLAGLIVGACVFFIVFHKSK